MTITNLDPKPWDANTATPASPNDNRYDYEQGLELNQNGWALEYDPRPEFDVRSNPLLEIFADELEQDDGVTPVADLARRFLDEHERYVELSSIPERLYAEEVLERIVEASA